MSHKTTEEKAALYDYLIRVGYVSPETCADRIADATAALTTQLQAAQATIAAIRKIQNETECDPEHDDSFWADWYQEKSERIDKILSPVTPTENGENTHE